MSDNVARKVGNRRCSALSAEKESTGLVSLSRLQKIFSGHCEKFAVQSADIMLVENTEKIRLFPGSFVTARSLEQSYFTRNREIKFIPCYLKPRLPELQPIISHINTESSTLHLSRDSYQCFTVTSIHQTHKCPKIKIGRQELFS